MREPSYKVMIVEAIVYFFIKQFSNIRCNRAYPENTNFDTFVARNLKFYTFVELHITKKC